LDLPQGALVGSSSLRRAAQVKHLRSDLHVIDYRGNVDTRLRKLDEGVVDATFLACAGLKRLGMAHEITSIMDEDQMLPAVAQGAIGIEVRADNAKIRDLIAPLNHMATAICVSVERAFLAALDGSCRTPIAGLAVVKDTQLSFRGMIISNDGATVHETRYEVSLEDAEEMGHQAGLELKARGGPDFFTAP
jgi:hydroxymethylbilane synthase